MADVSLYVLVVGRVVPDDVSLSVFSCSCGCRVVVVVVVACCCMLKAGRIRWTSGRVRRWALLC